jgi:hypothetical protein
MRRGSLLALLHYTRLLGDGQDRAADAITLWTDSGWRQVMTVGLPAFRINKLEDPEMRVTYEMYKHLFPADDDPDLSHMPTGTGNTLTHAANQLRTAFTNNLWVPLVPWLKRLCRALRRKRKQEQVAGSDDPSILDLVRAIETGADYAMEKQMHVAAVEFVTEVRRRLGLPDAGTKLTEFYAKRNQQQMLLFLAWLQRCVEALGGKGVQLCPVFSVRRQHVQLNCTTLLHMLSGMRLVSEHLMVKQGEATDWEGVLDLVAGMFEPPCLAKQKGKLQWWGFLSTDGVAASFVFADTRPVSKKGTKAAAAAAAVTSSSSSSHMCTRSPHRHTRVHAPFLNLCGCQV